MVKAIQMGGLLFRGGRVLEPGRRRNFRVHDQSAHRSLLHAGFEHNRGTCSRRTIWSLWHARPWLTALLLASDEARAQMEGRAHLVRILGHQYRADAGDLVESVARWSHADLSISLSWLLVRPEFGVYANRSDANAALDAHDRRHHFRPWCNLVRLLCARPNVPASSGNRLANFRDGPSRSQIDRVVSSRTATGGVQ